MDMDVLLLLMMDGRWGRSSESCSRLPSMRAAATDADCICNFPAGTADSAPSGR